MKRLKKPYYKEPRGGWHLIVDTICFRGEGPDEVIAKVREYLLANGRPPRDIMGDLVTYCEANYPNLVEPDYDNTPPPPIDPLERVMNKNMALSRRPLVNAPDKEEEVRRTEVCIKCPYNQKFSGPLEPEVARASYLLTKGSLCGLGHCGHHGWDNRVAVKWDKELLKLAAEAPISGCWL